MTYSHHDRGRARDADADLAEAPAPRLERVFESLFEHSAAGVIISRPDGTVLRANPAACRMLGRTEEEIRRVGRQGVVVDDERFRAFLAERERNGVAHGEVLHQRPDGSTYVAEQTSAMLPAQDGERWGFVIFHDVTERLRTEEALRRHELLVAKSRDAMLVVRRDDGRILEANHAAVDAYGYGPAELRALTIQDLRAPDTRPLTEAQMAQADAGGVLFETIHRRKDGRTFPVEVSSQGAAVGGVRLLVSVIRDISARRRVEEELRESDRRKSEFLAMLSHELRNPLAPILTAVALLRRAGASAADGERARQVIERQALHLARLVDDLLDVTRIARGRIALEPAVLDARELLRRAADDHRATFEERGVALALEVPATPVWIHADATRLGQALGNLLQNAAKFTPPGGRAALSTRAVADAAELRVRDDGIGISAEVLARIFEPFVQADRTLARTKGGLGLGLSLVKGLAELHGGEVRAASDGPGRGAEFVVALPLAPAPAPPAPPLAAPRARPLSVLLVEDNADAAETLADALSLDGHRVEVAPDGRAGIARARELAPDVVLCDIGLPDVDGYEVARTLRADPALRKTRLVALSGYAQPEDRERAREAGFDAHVAKPASLDTLSALLAGER